MKHPIPKATQVLKRIMDLAGASLGLLLTLPLWPLIMLAIRLDSPGPVFFRQLRIGRGRSAPASPTGWRMRCPSLSSAPMK